MCIESPITQLTKIIRKNNLLSKLKFSEVILLYFQHLLLKGFFNKIYQNTINLKNKTL